MGAPSAKKVKKADRPDWVGEGGVQGLGKSPAAKGAAGWVLPEPALGSQLLSLNKDRAGEAGGGRERTSRETSEEAKQMMWLSNPFLLDHLRRAR